MGIASHLEHASKVEIVYSPEVGPVGSISPAISVRPNMPHVDGSIKKSARGLKHRKISDNEEENWLK